MIVIARSIELDEGDAAISKPGSLLPVKAFPLTPALSSFGKLRMVSLSNHTAGKERIRMVAIIGFAMTEMIFS